MDHIKRLFQEQPPKATWRTVLSPLVNSSWNIEADLNNFRSARRLAQAVLVALMSAHPIMNARPTSYQLEEATQALLHANRDDEARNILQMDLNPPEAVHNYRAIQQFEGHKRKLPCPPEVQSFQDFMAWFSYELPLGGKLNEWRFVQYNTDVIVKHESVYISIMEKMVWKLFCPTLLVLGAAFLVHFVVGTYGVALPQVSPNFFGARKNDNATSLHPAATLIATFIANLPLISNFNEDWMYAPRRHVLIPMSLAASSTLAILANFSELFWWMIGTAIVLALFALVFGWRRGIAAFCRCNCCRRQR